MDFGVPARAIFPPGTEKSRRDTIGQRCSAGQGVFAGSGDQDELFQAFGVGVGVFDANRAAEGMADENEFFSQSQFFDNCLQVLDHLDHRILSIGRVALPMPAQVGSHDAVFAGEVVDLVFPGFGAAGIAMHEHDGTFHRFGPDVNHTERGVGDVADGDFGAVQVVV